jgi:hypothetical protein
MSEPRFEAQHVQSRLMRESLMDKSVIAATESPVRAILPNLNVVQIGGLSIMDRRHTAVLPLLDEIVANQANYWEELRYMNHVATSPAVARKIAAVVIRPRMFMPRVPVAAKIW